jgi:hypothetical protein
MAVVLLTSGSTTILLKTTVSVFIDEMGSFVLVTAPQYKFIFKNKKKFFLPVLMDSPLVCRIGELLHVHFSNNCIGHLSHS